MDSNFHNERKHYYLFIEKKKFMELAFTTRSTKNLLFNYK